MRGWTNAQRNDASDGVTLIAEDLTYSNGQRIQFFALTGKSWFSIASNKTDITLKKGGRYFITYSFTPSTADGGIAGPDNYANAKVWGTGGYSMFFDQTNGDRVFYLYNNGTASNTFAWFRMTILRMGGGIKALLGKARALLQEVLSHAGRYQCDKQGTAIHRLAYFERKMDTQRGRRAGNDRWIIGHRQWGSIDHGMHRAPHEITGWECKLPNIRPIRLGHMSRLCYGGRDPEIQLDGHNDRIWDGNVQYRMTKGMVA